MNFHVPRVVVQVFVVQIVSDDIHIYIAMKISTLKKMPK